MNYIALKKMVTKIFRIIKNKSIQICFGLLAVLLSYIYFPVFSHPPRSDHWPALYFFYRIDELLGPGKWRYILTYDPLIRVTFRPISILAAYFEKLIFGSSFFFVQSITFILYFINILLLYKLMTYFCKNKILIAVFLCIFSVLFSHFDLVCWSFQSHIILSLCLFLAGFILYINYLSSYRKIILVFVAILFLLGMLCYEVFLFWPLAIVILSYVYKPIKEGGQTKKIRLSLGFLPVIFFVYIFYILFLFLSNVFKAYGDSQISLASLFSLDSFLSTLFVVFFNILYNNLTVNLLPQIAFPLKTSDSNLNMSGFIMSGYLDLDGLMVIGGSFILGVFLIAVFYLYRKRNFETLRIFMFLAFLLFSELFVLFFLKSLVNASSYNLTQFRFQYIPNAIFFLIVIFLIDKLIKLTRRNKIIISLILSFVFVMNIQATAKGISILNIQLAPLKRLLTNISTSLKSGQVNQDNRLYLDDEIAKRLPILCWNKEMGKRCMRGTYQWIFSKEEIKCFAPYEDAKWIINETDLSIVSK